jgi:hypothetical protein
MLEQISKKQVNCPICKYSNQIEYYDDELFFIEELVDEVKIKLHVNQEEANPILMYIHSCKNCGYSDFVPYFLESYKFSETEFKKIRDILFDNSFRKNELKLFQYSEKYSWPVRKQINYYQAIYINRIAKTHNYKKLFKLCYYLSQAQDNLVVLTKNPQFMYEELITDFEEKINNLVSNNLQDLDKKLNDDSTEMVFAKQSENTIQEITDHFSKILFELNDLKVHYKNKYGKTTKAVKSEFRKNFLPDYLHSEFKNSNDLLSASLDYYLMHIEHHQSISNEHDRLDDLRKAFTIAHYLHDLDKKFSILNEVKKTVMLYEKKVQQKIESNKETMTLQEKRFILGKLSSIKEQCKVIISNEDLIIKDLVRANRKEMESYITGRLAYNKRKKKKILIDKGYPNDLVNYFLECVSV